MSLKTTPAQTRKLYEDILDAIEELMLQAADADEDEDSNDDVIRAMSEEAAERGLDEEQVEKIFHAIDRMVRR